MEEVEFLFDNQLIAAVEKLIRNAKHKLILISPFIDLDRRIKDALNEKKSLHNFELLVLFGKNENNLYKSIKKGSLEFLMQFPNVEIRYNESLHAKFYQNDFEYIMTSLNLYDYSLANNIEVGIRGEYASRGLLAKAILDTSETLINQGVDKVKQDVLGRTKEVNVIEKFKQIFETSERKYKTVPTIADKGGLQGLVGFKKLDGFTVIENKFEVNTISTAQQTNAKSTETTIKAKSTTVKKLAQELGITPNDITNLMQRKGLLSGKNITESGTAKGLTMKTYMGNEYIEFPANLTELDELKKTPNR
jgi:hypothetical protein